MEELELLKKDWNKKYDDFKDYSEREIHEMIKHKSVSVTKTLFIIGLIEILLWTVYGYIYEQLSYVRIGLFAVFFALTIHLFNKIKTGENSIVLMKNILNLRKVILGYAGISFLFIVGMNIIDFDRDTRSFMAGYRDGRELNEYHTTNPDSIIPEWSNYIVFGIILIFTMYLIYFVYKKTYGRILFDLKKNYGELSKAEGKPEID